MVSESGRSLAAAGGARPGASGAGRAGTRRRYVSVVLLPSNVAFDTHSYLRHHTHAYHSCYTHTHTHTPQAQPGLRYE